MDGAAQVYALTPLSLAVLTRESSGPETGSALTTLRESKIEVRPMVAPPFYLFISRSLLSAHRVCVGYSRLIAHPHDSLPDIGRSRPTLLKTLLSNPDCA